MITQQTTNLIRTLGSAEKGSRELSDEVLLALGWRPFEDRELGFAHSRVSWRNPAGETRCPPDVTVSFEEGLAYLGSRWLPVHMAWNNGAVTLCLSHRSNGELVSGAGKTPALAASVAILGIHS